ncbi:MAG TPA: molybdopterin cofactor-binding domain-containing protein [Gaiellaceae bacterium]|nr:molybdopterin cofactor-binding domain-containing protein [Gaiellaceae bacterium]
MTQTAEATQEQAKRYVGGGVLRKEDPELLTGQARFIDDIALPGMLWVGVVRSPFAHARINGVDGSRALELPGVVAVLSGEELAGDWEAGLPCAWPIATRSWPTPTDEDPRMPDHWPVAHDKARFVGDPVAVVVADSRAHAKDALEAVDVDYEPLEPVLDVEQALGGDAPRCHEDLGDNRCYTWTLENGEVERVFSEAPVVVKERYRHPRLIPNAIEPRGVVVQPAPAQGEFTMWSATQIPHIAKVTLSLTTGIPESKLRVIAPDVGGGFGSKLNVYAEEAVCLAVARRLGLPVKWIEERSENYLGTIHGRGVVQDMELAATEEGKVVGVRARVLADFGAYLQLVAPGIPLLGAFIYHGLYDPEAYLFECTGVFTNRTPTDAYRGAGRPEATYAIERTIDALARRLGKDPVELRRRNFIPPFDEPRATAGGLEFDSGNYPATLDKALELADYEGLRREQAERRARGDGKALGIGLATYIEMCGLAPSQVLSALKYGAGGWDAATIRCHPTGKVTVVTGTSPHGQGHVTSWAQIAADELGVAFEDVEVLHGDTAIAPLGMDTYGSRSLAVGGIALWNAAQKIKEKAKRIAAHDLEVSPDDLEWTDGKFQVRGVPDKSKTIPDVAFAAWTAHSLPDDVEPGLEATHVYDPPNFTFPAGAHVCAVEVDTETGEVEILKYVAVDDCGNVINPTIVEGQVHGGVAQGIAEALYEEAVYDDAGNLLTSSMHSYRIPSAAELPSFVTDRTVTPSSTNPMGVKGVGEAGTIAAPAAVMNAVADALAPLGVTKIDLPATPERVWRAIRDAKGGAQ